MRTRTTTTTKRGYVQRVAGRHFTTTTTNTTKYYYIYATYSNSDDGHCPKLPCQRSSDADIGVVVVVVVVDVTSECGKRGGWGRVKILERRRGPHKTKRANQKCDGGVARLTAYDMTCRKCKWKKDYNKIKIARA